MILKYKNFEIINITQIISLEIFESDIIFYFNGGCKIIWSFDDVEEAYKIHQKIMNKYQIDLDLSPLWSTK